MEILKSTGMSYYAVQVQNQREKSVSERIIHEGEKGTLLGKIGNVLVPMESIYLVKDGKRIKKEKILLPGYIFIETSSVGEVKYFLRGLKGTSGFLTSRNGNIDPLTEAEVNKMMGNNDKDEKEVETDAFAIGEEVLIIDGPFSSMKAVIDEITGRKVKLNVSIFGRKTPLMLEIHQIDKKL